MTTSTLHEQTARLSEAEIIGLTDYEQPAKQINAELSCPKRPAQEHANGTE